MMGSSPAQLKMQEEARSTWRYCWHKNSLHSAMSLSIEAAKYVSSNVPKYVSPISTAHFVASGGALLPILISSLSLLITSCRRYCVIMVCWNIIPDWQPASITRSSCNLAEKKKWSCEPRRSGHANCCGVRCLAHPAGLLRQLRSINCCGTLDKTPRECAHTTVQELSIISRGRFIVPNADVSAFKGYMCNYKGSLHH